MKNHKPKVLIVVDMQHLFKTANDPRTIANCQKLIRNAVARQEFIIFLEFFNYGKTLAELTSVIPKDYKFCVTVVKFLDDGSSYIWDLLANNMYLRDKDITVCGVNLGACVKSTILGLEEDIENAVFPTKIHLVSNACNCNGSRYYQKETLLGLKKHIHVTNVSSYLRANKTPLELAQMARQNDARQQALAA